MPIYGYRCSQCGHEMEVLQSMSDAPLRECAECSGALQKLLYPVGVHFKGSGFYSTDYKGGRDRSGSKKTTSNGGGESSGDASSAPSSSTASTETRSETAATKE